jgi:hypothetical protein
LFSLDVVSTHLSDYALKTSWRFIALVYSLALTLLLAIVTTRWWAGSHAFTGWVFVIIFSISVVLVCCFAFAAVAWAALSFRGRLPEERRRAWLGLAAALFTFALCTAYLLLLTGVIRPFNI